MIMEMHPKKTLQILNIFLVLIFTATSCNLPAKTQDAIIEASVTPVDLSKQPSFQPTPSPESGTKAPQGDTSPIPLSPGPIFAVFEATPGETTALIGRINRSRFE